MTWTVNNVKIIIKTNTGTFAAYLTSTGSISIYEGDQSEVAAIIEPGVKRKAVPDLSTDGIAHAVRSWLETTHDRIEIERVTVHLVPSGR